MLWTLLIPDLASASATVGRLPALETLCACAHAGDVPRSNLLDLLADIFGMPTTNLAMAPLTHLADTGTRDNAYYFRADPVHLAADRDQLVMLPLSALQVQPDEGSMFSQTFNHMYGAEGYWLETPHPERWYLRSPVSFRCVTHDPALVVGQSVFELMPSGEDGQRLRRLMNEVQMLLHEHPLNQAREKHCCTAINSLWIWGGGRLPESPAVGCIGVRTDSPLVAGFARFAGSQCHGWPAGLDVPSVTVPQLVAVRCTTAAEITTLEERVAAPLLEALRRGNASGILIYPGNGRSYRATPASLRKFWRRRRPLVGLLGRS